MEAETAHQVIVNHTIPQQDTGSAVHPDQVRLAASATARLLLLLRILT